MKQIKVVFDTETGEAKIDATGYHGKSCTEATKFLRELGMVESETRKAEYYQTGALNQTIQNRG